MDMWNARTFLKNVLDISPGIKSSLVEMLLQNFVKFSKRFF